MVNLEFRKPYQLCHIIDAFSQNILKNGFSNCNFCIYSIGDIATSYLICYLESPPTFNEDEEVYPEFIQKNILSLFYYGNQFEDVLMNVSHQKSDAKVDDYILGLNYYSENDTFKEFS